MSEPKRQTNKNVLSVRLARRRSSADERMMRRRRPGYERGARSRKSRTKGRSLRRAVAPERRVHPPRREEDVASLLNLLQPLQAWIDVLDGRRRAQRVVISPASSGKPPTSTRCRGAHLIGLEIERQGAPSSRSVNVIVACPATRSVRSGGIVNDRAYRRSATRVARSSANDSVTPRRAPDGCRPGSVPAPTAPAAFDLFSAKSTGCRPKSSPPRLPFGRRNGHHATLTVAVAARLCRRVQPLPKR